MMRLKRYPSPRSVPEFPARVGLACGRPYAEVTASWTKRRIGPRSNEIDTGRTFVEVVGRFSEAEAEKFWPVYEQYVSDLVKLNGTKYALIKQYIQTQGALTDTEAASSVDQ
jgi:hypothetical protein